MVGVRPIEEQHASHLGVARGGRRGESRVTELVLCVDIDTVLKQLIHNLHTYTHIPEW